MFLNFANRYITCAVIQPNTFILKREILPYGKALIFNLERSQKNDVIETRYLELQLAAGAATVSTFPRLPPAGDRGA